MYGALADWATFFLHHLQRTWTSLPLSHRFDIQGLLSLTNILGSPINFNLSVSLRGFACWVDQQDVSHLPTGPRMETENRTHIWDAAR